LLPDFSRPVSTPPPKKSYFCHGLLGLAKLSGVPQPNIHLIEKGEMGITARVWAALTTAISKQRRKNREAEKLDRAVTLAELFSPDEDRYLLALRNQRTASKATAKGVDLDKQCEQQKQVIESLRTDDLKSQVEQSRDLKQREVLLRDLLEIAPAAAKVI
jgi:hypothetical protein